MWWWDTDEHERRACTMSQIINIRKKFLEQPLSTILTEEEEFVEGEEAPRTPFHLSKTKLIATVGPKSCSVDVLKQLLQAGIQAVRFDFTWCTLEVQGFFDRTYENLLQACHETKKMCAIMVDLAGRELYLKGKHAVGEDGWPRRVENPVTVESGQIIYLSCDEADQDKKDTFLVNYDDFYEMARVGDTIHLGRYLSTGAEASAVYVDVLEVTGKKIKCKCKNPAVLDGLVTVFHCERSKSGQENVQNLLPIMTDADKEALKRWSTREVDFVLIPYPKCKEDVQEVRDYLDFLGMHETLCISKIESRAALNCFEEILDVSYGVVISRSSLGMDMPIEKSVKIQKELIKRCNFVGKPCIITRVVDTMTNSPRPTRAEATDVANAVLDGTDAILLGAETTRGKFPVESVNTVKDICRQAEMVYNNDYHFKSIMRALGIDGHTPDVGEPMSEAEAMASSTVRAADKTNAAMILCFTESGTFARQVAKYRPNMPILAITVPTLKVKGCSWTLLGRRAARQNLIIRGVFPKLADPKTGLQEGWILQDAIKFSIAQGMLRKDDFVVVCHRLRGDLVISIVSVNDALGITMRSGSELGQRHASTSSMTSLVTSEGDDQYGSLSSSFEHGCAVKAQPGDSKSRSPKHNGKGLKPLSEEPRAEEKATASSGDDPVKTKIKRGFFSS